MFSKFDDFSREAIDRRHKHCENYLRLCDAAEMLLQSEKSLEKQNVVLEFWKYIYSKNLDENKPGAEGFVESLLDLFKPLLGLQPFLQTIKKCHSCHFEEKKRSRWPLPLRIQDINDLNFMSIKQFFSWFMDKKFQECELCSQKQMESGLVLKQDPNFVILEFMSSHLNQKGHEHFEYDEIIENEITNTKFRLFATINRPSENHFSCSIKEPYFPNLKLSLNGWFNQDGLVNNGKFRPLEHITQLYHQRPFILFYKKAI